MTAPTSARLTIRFPSERDARAVVAALDADDDSYVTTSRDQSLVVIDVQAPDVRGLRRAVDDVLANLGVSEDVLDEGPVNKFRGPKTF